MDRRDLLRLGIAVSHFFLMGSSAKVALATEKSNRSVVWGGSGFNVPFDEIDTRLSRVKSVLEAGGQAGWRSWLEQLYAELTVGFDGVVESGPGMKLRFESDPGLIFSVGFDYENFLRIDIEPGELSGDGSDGERDISFYYLFSSIRMYSIQLPRQQRGQIGLVYSKPIRSFNRSLLPTGGSAEEPFVRETLMGREQFSTLSKFGGLVTQVAVEESFFEPKHLRVRGANLSSVASQRFEELRLSNTFNPNFFASIVGVSVNQAFEASVLPFVMTDYLSSTLRSRFDSEPEIGKIFKDMDEDVASFYIDLNVTKVLRKVSAETAAKQQIARGLAMDIEFIDVANGSSVFSTKLVRVEKREQVKGAKEESWYRSNDSLYFYYLIDKMVADFFDGVLSGDRKVLKESGVRAQDASDAQITALRDVLNSCRYGS